MNVHIVGGGIAGAMAALAFSSQKNVKNVFLYEQSKRLFSYASSKNAAILRTYERDPFVSRLVKQSALWFYLLSRETPNLVEYSGLRIIPGEYDLLELEFKSANEWKSFLSLNNPALGLSTSWNAIISYLDSLYSRAVDKSNVFKYDSEREILGSGVVDLDIFLYWLESKLLSKSKISILYEQKLLSYSLNQKNSIEKLIFSSNQKIQILDEDLIVNAGGSWSKEIYNLLNQNKKEILLKIPPLHSYKRHLHQYYLDDRDKSAKNIIDFGVFWNEREDLYFRKNNQNRFIISDCEEVKTFSSDFSLEPNKLSEEFVLNLKSKIGINEKLKYDYSWSCLRTFTLDDRPIIGMDSTVSNLFWVSGLGGRGLSISLAIPELLLSIWKSQVSKTGHSQYLQAFTLERFF